MANPYVNKVVVDGVTKLNLEADTVEPSKLLSGETAHDASGAPITGTCTFDSDTSNDDLTAAEALVGKKFHARGTEFTGTMPNRGAIAEVIDDVDDVITVPAGYHDGSGTVQMDSTEKAKLIAGNIKDGVELFGVTGTYTGEGVTAQAKEATPTFNQQVITPDQGYDYLSQVTVGAIPVTYTDNAAGGQTLTIG